MGLLRRNWWTLASPPEKFDPEVVREFYANAYPSSDPEAVYHKRSMVRGVEIPYDRATLNELLDRPYRKPPSAAFVDRYHELLSVEDGFDLERTEQLLCLEGRRAEYSENGEPLKMHRKDLKRIAKVWLAFMMSNLVPNSHITDFTIEDAHFLYCIMNENISVCAATKMSEVIYQNVLKGGRAQRLGFPSFITLLCERHGVVVNRTEKIRDPINLFHINRYCKEEAQAGPVGPPQPQAPAMGPPRSIEQLWRRMEREFQRIHVRMDRQDQEAQHARLRDASLHRAIDWIYDCEYKMAQIRIPEQEICPPVQQFRDHVAWPGDSPIFPGGDGAAAAAAGEGEQDDDDADGNGDEYLQDLEEDEEHNPLL